jgi:hypothetical protein
MPLAPPQQRGTWQEHDMRRVWWTSCLCGKGTVWLAEDDRPGRNGAHDLTSCAPHLPVPFAVLVFGDVSIAERLHESHDGVFLGVSQTQVSQFIPVHVE